MSATGRWRRATEEAELSEEKTSEWLRSYLESLEPWVETWPAEARGEARMRIELCRLQMKHYMWGKSHTLFRDQDLPVGLFTEIWWNTLVAPLASIKADCGQETLGEQNQVPG